MEIKPQILDSTLREGEQTPNVSFTLEDKLGIAQLLDDFGVDFIELGHPAVSPDLRAAVTALNELDLKAHKVAHGRATLSDVDEAVAIGVPWLGVFYGTSPLSLKYKFNVTPKKALEQIERVVKYAKDKGLKLRFTAEDASRTDMDFLLKVALLVQDAGADRFSVADTVGILTPRRMYALISRLKAEVEIPLHVHCHNDFGLASANALAALEAGALCVDVTVNSLGERCGLASLTEVSTALINLYKVDCNFDLTLLPGLSSRVEKATGLPPGFNQPVVGKHAFTHKAGLHVRAVLENPESYEAIDPRTVNRQRKLVLDKYTGKAAIKNKFSEMGLDLNQAELEIALKHIKSEPDKVHWSEEELRNMLRTIQSNS